jgi:hypothetical protein
MIGIINALISKVGIVLAAVLALLPDSPFNWTYGLDSGWIGNMNYILPFSQAVAHLEAYILAVIVYYGIRIVLRWVKAAGN